MILTGNEINVQQSMGLITISDWDQARLGPNSYNLRLAPELLVYKEVVLDAKQPNRTERLTIPEEGLVLEPGELYLGKTMEFTSTKHYVPMLEGRSSVGRLGLFIHATAGFGDIGFSGNWTLEITCTKPVRVYPGMEVCQIYFIRPWGHVAKLYEGKYQGSTEIGASELWRDFEKED